MAVRYVINPRSRLGRGLLALAMLAWAALAFDAMAHPAMMPAGHGNSTGMAMDAQAMPCDQMPAMDMSPAGQHEAPCQSPEQGLGCCHGGCCHCATPCSSVMGVAGIGTTWLPPVAATFSATPDPWVASHGTPPLRPPIA